MNYSIGDGIAAIALTGGIVGYVYVTHRTRQRRMEIIHQERMAALEKGIPLPEFPADLLHDKKSDSPPVLPVMGTVFTALSLGAMIVLHMNLPADRYALWITPLPLLFLGIGLIAFHFLSRETGR